MNEIYVLRTWLIQTGEPGWLDTKLWVYLSGPREEDGDLCALHQFLWLLLFLVLEGEDCFTYLPGRLHYSCCDRVRVCGCSCLARVAPLPSRPPGSSMARLGRRGHSTGTRFMCAMLIDLESFIYWIWNTLHSITMGFAASSWPGWIRLFTWSGTCDRGEKFYTLPPPRSQNSILEFIFIEIKVWRHILYDSVTSARPWE